LDEKLQQKRIGGVLEALFGKGSSKLGFVQRKVIGGNMDFSALGVATLDPTLKLNQLGLPVEQAWKLYDKYVVRELIKSNYPATMAVKAVQERTPEALKALQSVVTARPVIMNRAPTLHRHNMLAFEPVLTAGHTVRTPVGIQGGYNLDYDGNCVDFDSRIVVRLPKSELDKWLSTIYGISKVTINK
jgi:DNA-directed RNA polymerase subunit beta'